MTWPPALTGLSADPVTQCRSDGCAELFDRAGVNVIYVILREGWGTCGKPPSRRLEAPLRPPCR